MYPLDLLDPETRERMACQMPPDVTVTVRALAGMGDQPTDAPGRRHDDGRGTTGPREVFEVRVQRRFLGRIGGRIWQFLTRPLARL